MNTKITFINKSWDDNNSKVVIFQKNVATDLISTITAWKVIKHCGYNWSHDFLYTTAFDVAVKDSYHNHSDQKEAIPGNKWIVQEKPEGNTLELSNQNAANREEVEIKNDLGIGSIDAQIYKQGGLVATKRGIPPGQKATFKFEPYIYVGVHSQIEQDKVISSAILTENNTRFSLAGINEAQLILTGGGTGPTATPFKFDLIRLS